MLKFHQLPQKTLKLGNVHHKNYIKTSFIFKSTKKITLDKKWSNQQNKATTYIRGYF